MLTQNHIRTRLRQLGIASALSGLISALPSCSGNAAPTTAPADAALEGVPELGAVELALTSGDAEAVATSEDAVSADDSAESAADAATGLEEIELPEQAPELVHIRGEIRELNVTLRRFLRPIAALVRNQAPSEHLGKVRVWGPLQIDGTEYRFLARPNEARKRVAWRLDARLSGSDDFQPVAAGEITVGETPRRGQGALGVNLTLLSELAPRVEAQGLMLAGFRHGALGSTVAYALKDFRADANASPISARIRGIHRSDGLRKVRLAFRGNLPGSATDAEELILARARHMPGSGGRVDLLGLGGDLPDGTVRLTSACWDAELAPVFRRVLSCSAEALDAAACTVESETGERSSCPRGAEQEELPTLDPEAVEPDSDDPNTEVQSPDAMPTFDASAE